ncbi:hypothetical protein K2173_017749 [Erythroxylum novogranatense]|uniref:Plastocyanin-like domain-containing protein n=1 Tax=Erythroxylum novogranatense TaxID=1862640 RepID=A0AAV8SLM1_9ROSI|nr:hypothetical protein K2173_017749 [Erythroxylum novogranatense]
MALIRFSPFVLVYIALFSRLCFAADPTISYDFKVIAIGGNFPGPLINATTNYNVVVNVHSGLDENFLMTWTGIQMRRNSWQDGVLGTTCPIHSKQNFTCNFQVKDQIGSYFYGPSLNLQRASGGFGPFIVNNREIIAIPFAQPDGDFIIMIGDRYTQNRTVVQHRS